MRINIETETTLPSDEPRVGNVYAVRGGRGMRDGNMMVLIAITRAKDRYDDIRALMLVIDKEGEPRGVSHYGLHYIRDLSPIAFVEGVENIELTMRSI